MKAVDLHIHTVATISDSKFDFSMEELKNYVEKMGLDIIAITNPVSYTHLTLPTNSRG